jgi:hypothetical protein
VRQNKRLGYFRLHKTLIDTRHVCTTSFSLGKTFTIHKTHLKKG